MKEFEYLINDRVRKQVFKFLPPRLNIEFTERHRLCLYGDHVVVCTDQGWFWTDRYSGYNNEEWNRAFFEALEKYLIKKKELPDDYVLRFGENKGKLWKSPQRVQVRGEKAAIGFVYFIRNGEPPQDVYKIGETQNLLQRFKELKPDEVLNIVRCSNRLELEKEIHYTFKEARIPQTEYFRLDESQREAVHQIIRSKSKY